jgi:translation initiation factor IF-2
MAEGIQLETLGGDVPVVPVSGLTGLGLPTLVETLSAVAEMKDLRAETNGRVHGHVLESRVQKGLGCVLLWMLALDNFSSVGTVLSLPFLSCEAP